MNRRHWLAGAGALAVSACQTTPTLQAPLAPTGPRVDEHDLERAIRAYFDPLAATRDVSGKLRIVRGGNVTEVWYGYDDWSTHKPLTPVTRFACASVTKSITATILVKLAEQGALSLSDSISTHLPAYQHGGAMTIEHVIRHTAGLPRNIPDDERAALGPDGLIDWLNAHPPAGAPGASESYSNLGYEVLALIAERASGRAYADLARSFVFEPLGMRNASLERDSLNANSARPHVPGPPPEEVRGDPGSSFPLGPAGLSASMDDLITWSHAVRDGTIAQLRQPGGKYLGSVLPFEEGGKTGLFLQGTIRGSGAGVVTITGEDVTVAYQLNLESYPQLSAQRVLTKLAFGIDPGAPPLRAPAVALTEAHRALAGTYSSDAFGQLRFYERDGEMRILMLGLGVDQYATPISDNRLNWRCFNFTFGPRRDASGALIGLNVEQTMFDAGEAGRVMSRVT